MNYPDDLSRELSAVGISGRLRSRIVDEFNDHIACDPSAPLGEPRAIARQFADEVGTSRARRAGFISFAALALAGVLFGLAFVIPPEGPLVYASPTSHISWLATFAGAVAVLAAQVALAAGVLAALRAIRHRGDGVIAGAEAQLLTRRAAVGLIAGIVTMAALGGLALALRGHVASWWVTMTIAFALAAIVGLAAALPAVIAALRVHPVAPGDADDIFYDLGRWAPKPLRGHPWWLASLVAAAIVLVLTVAGVAKSDGFDGAARGVGDALVCLALFATLGRWLGIWRRAPLAPDAEPAA